MGHQRREKNRSEGGAQLARNGRVLGDVALVHDYLTQRGGAERVVLAMSRAFPSASIYTALYEPSGTYAEFAGRDVRPLPINRVGILRRSHRLALPVLAPAFSRLRLEGGVALCSSSGWAHGVRTTGRKIVYCHSPAKWLYVPDRYFGEGMSPARALVSPLRPALTRWDRAAAASADRYLVNSTMVKTWVQDVYGIEAEVLAPPHGVDADGPSRPVEGLEAGFLLCVSRLMTYKNVLPLVDAFAELPGQRLVIVGSGPLEAEIRERAGSNVTLLGRVDDEQLRWLYQASSAVVAAAHEDFGLTPIEAAAFGRPVAVLRWGGFLDTVLEGVTGVYFDAPTARDIADAVRTVSRETWDEEAIRAHAESYSEERFVAELHRIVAEESAQLGAGRP